MRIVGLFLLLALPCFADVLDLADGRRLVGDVSEKNGVYSIRIDGEELTFAKEDVKLWIKSPKEMLGDADKSVEAAKKLLSYELEAMLEIQKEALNIYERLDRDEFTHIIEPTLDDMFASIDEAEKVAGVKSTEIDYVLTTGGTSLIPAVRNMLAKRFGQEKLLERDTFTSVATGLAVVSQFV